jgi:hypothetical protein
MTEPVFRGRGNPPLSCNFARAYWGFLHISRKVGMSLNVSRYVGGSTQGNHEFAISRHPVEDCRQHHVPYWPVLIATRPRPSAQVISQFAECASFLGEIVHASSLAPPPWHWSPDWEPSPLEIPRAAARLADDVHVPIVRRYLDVAFPVAFQTTQISSDPSSADLCIIFAFRHADAPSLCHLEFHTLSLITAVRLTKVTPAT